MSLLSQGPKPANKSVSSGWVVVMRLDNTIDLNIRYDRFVMYRADLFTAIQLVDAFTIRACNGAGFVNNRSSTCRSCFVAMLFQSIPKNKDPTNCFVGSLGAFSPSTVCCTLCACLAALRSSPLVSFTNDRYHRSRKPLTGSMRAMHLALLADDAVLLRFDRSQAMQARPGP